MTSVLLAAPVSIAEQRTGPAIRYWEFARVLSAELAVTLLVPNRDHPTHPGFAVRACEGDELEVLLDEHSVIVVQGPALQYYPQIIPVLARGSHYLVADLYDPISLEQLEIDRGGEIGRWLHLEYLALLNEQLRIGDFFLCSSERQRDYWLGALNALGRVNHDTYDGAELRQLIDVVPFGLPTRTPQRGEPVLKGVVPGIMHGDRVILWGGGMWSWLDPLTPIQAMRHVVNRQPRARLVFFESRRQPSDMLIRAKQLAAEMQLLGRHVFFAQWQPPEQWETCLLEADIGLSFHHANVETHFSFRTRLLDYVWTGLPIVTATGDVMSEEVARRGLGYAVRPGDAQALSDALLALLDEPDARDRRQGAFRKFAAQYRWQHVVEPLLHYCRQPWRAGDRDKRSYDYWQMVKRDRLLSNLAHAERRRVEVQAEAAHQTEALQAQIDELSRRLRQHEEQLQAAMNGRVMRLLTGAERALRRLRRGQP